MIVEDEINEELREKVIDYLISGHSFREAVNYFGLNYFTISDWALESDRYKKHSKEDQLNMVKKKAQI